MLGRNFFIRPSVRRPIIMGRIRPLADVINARLQGQPNLKNGSNRSHEALSQSIPMLRALAPTRHPLPFPLGSYRFPTWQSTSRSRSRRTWCYDVTDTITLQEISHPYKFFFFFFFFPYLSISLSDTHARTHARTLDHDKRRSLWFFLTNPTSFFFSFFSHLSRSFCHAFPRRGTGCQQKGEGGSDGTSPPKPNLGRSYPMLLRRLLRMEMSYIEEIHPLWVRLI